MNTTLSRRTLLRGASGPVRRLHGVRHCMPCGHGGVGPIRRTRHPSAGGSGAFRQGLGERGVVAEGLGDVLLLRGRYDKAERSLAHARSLASSADPNAARMIFNDRLDAALCLFFMAIGMQIDLPLVARQGWLLALALAGLLTIKGTLIAGLCLRWAAVSAP